MGDDGSRHRDIMKNGLYSIHVSLQDGRVGKGSGVIVFRDGKITKDEPVADRSDATQVLKTLPTLED